PSGPRCLIADAALAGRGIASVRSVAQQAVWPHLQGAYPIHGYAVACIVPDQVILQGQLRGPFLKAFGAYAAAVVALHRVAVDAQGPAGPDEDTVPGIARHFIAQDAYLAATDQCQATPEGRAIQPA